VTAPRLEVDLAAIEHNARCLVGPLAAHGIRVTGVCKAALASTDVAEAMVRGGVSGLGDSRVENLARLRAAGTVERLTLIRSPMLSQAAAVVRHADASLNSEPLVLDALSAAAHDQDVTHDVVLMVELGDLREGVAADDLVDLARSVARRPGLRLAGIGTNLACQCGVAPTQQKMDELTRLALQVEAICGPLSIVSGGNSANLDWALDAPDVGRVDELRLGEAILLGTEPLHRRVLNGLRTDAFTLVAEVIESREKPAQPWGSIAQTAFGDPQPRPGTGTIRQLILALGRQDTDPDGLTPPVGITVLGMSSDHLVLDAGDHKVVVGEELRFQLNYSALVRATTSPFVTQRPA
jgi:predicted amino acid racemase